MADWRGRGGGRKPGQSSISVRASWVGAGKGKASASVSIETEGGAGKGGGRSGGQPAISDSGSWVGRGGGRGGSQGSIADSSQLGTRSEQATKPASGEASPYVADPEGNYIFALEIDGVEVAHFSECSGLKSSTEVYELQEGGMNYRVHKLPGQSRWDNIQLRYGVSNDITLLEWRGEILEDSFDSCSRRNGSIIMKNNQMDVVRRYNFEAAWPVAWEGPSFSANGSEVAIEMIELAHHGVYVS